MTGELTNHWMIESSLCHLYFLKASMSTPVYFLVKLNIKKKNNSDFWFLIYSLIFFGRFSLLLCSCKRGFLLEANIAVAFLEVTQFFLIDQYFTKRDELENQLILLFKIILHKKCTYNFEKLDLEDMLLYLLDRTSTI